jgi:peptidoglycan endopeptidase LytF
MVIHTVKNGDTLWGLKKQYGADVNEIKRINNLTSNSLNLGQNLKIPVAGTSTGTTVRPVSNTAKSKTVVIHTVKNGDTLWGLKKQYGADTNEIKRINSLTSNDLNLGQKLKIPVEGSSSGTVSTPTGRPTTNTPKPRVLTNPVSSGGGTSKEVNIATASGKTRSVVGSPSASILAAVAKNRRAAFKVGKINGLSIFGSGLSGSVGRGGANNPNDVRKVAQRLAQLKIIPSASASAASVATGIATFQRKFHAKWWASRIFAYGDVKVKLLPTTQYTDGKVSPNDATYMILRDFTRYRIEFRDPKGRTQVASFKDFPKSNYCAYARGISFMGTASHVLNFARVGAPPLLGKIFTFISGHEARFDGINSYDKAFFSWGFMQFAGGGRSLHTLLALMKYRNPELFYDVFQRFGVDVEYTFSNNRFQPTATRLAVFVPNPSDGKTILKGEEAEKHIRSNKFLHAVFIRAGHNQQIAELQALFAMYEYANPALKRSITVLGQKIKTTDIISSEAGMAALIDMSINKGVGGAARLFQNAIAATASASGIRSVSQLKGLNEAKILQNMINANRADKRISKRVGAAMQKFSTSK